MFPRKAIILAGGKGKRLRPLTYKTPKPLLKIKGKTVIEHIFKILKKFGINNIVISICYKKSMIKDYFKDGKNFGVKINYIEEKKPLGTAAPLILMDKIKETFIIVNGDNLFNLDLKKMYKMHKKNKSIATIALTKVKDAREYGSVTLKGDKIVHFIEKANKSNWVNSGYYILEPQVFNLLKGKKYAMLEKDVFPLLANQGKLFGYKDNGLWFDIGTIKNYENAKKEWRDI